MEICTECYSNAPRKTPLLHPRDCLLQHTQYVCGHCGRCICIEKEPKRGLQRWNFPFQSLEFAKFYLRAADATLHHACGIYEITAASGRVSYKIFACAEDLDGYLSKNKDKTCAQGKAVFEAERYVSYPQTRICRLTLAQVDTYLEEREEKRRL